MRHGKLPPLKRKSLVIQASRLQALLEKTRVMHLEHPWLRIRGTVTSVFEDHLKVSGISNFTHLGDRVSITTGDHVCDGEVIQINTDIVLVSLYSANPLICLGASVNIVSRPSISPDTSWQGRILNALCEPIDGRGPISIGPKPYAIDRSAVNALDRIRLGPRIHTGVRVIDMFTPVCLGQRLGIFSGSGVGKTTLVGFLAQTKEFDIIVVVLVGERGREVLEFVQETLAGDITRCVLVVATSDETALMRKRAPLTATTIAEYFRDQGMNVGLIVDSVSRFAHADRDLKLSAGEPPVARGYPPTVLSDISRLLERAGPGRQNQGTITAFYTVLVEGDDQNEPISDQMRGTLDGHVTLSRSIAERGRFPAVDIARSLSRAAGNLYTDLEKKMVRQARSLITEYEDSSDLRAVGAYTPGTNDPLDQALNVVPRLYKFLEQSEIDSTNHSISEYLAPLIKNNEHGVSQ